MQIQQESDDDITPAEALIQFLINQGSKVDIKDNEGFTPVQYAREERIRQMVLRSLSEDDVHTFRDLPIARSTEIHRIIGCEGGILHLDSCDITMSIPPGTVQAGSCHNVSIALVTDDPPPIREREFLTGHGIGITFPAQWRYSKNQPITLSLPHAATLLNSNDVHTDIIWKQTKSTSG
ncbi:uncharacterized protein LOC105439732 [Strongylocentrotus purpuratus]|uniref:ZU5 domain-containing protein n=1 Tax=Strongylocentrotus purpuratus TaxID=7668 RepID=A0A7M7PHT1_STRPU|nr:uncharacterized protein LOC105439732 [Strongylocentrotus purpuratus]